MENNNENITLFAENEEIKDTGVCDIQKLKSKNIKTLLVGMVIVGLVVVATIIFFVLSPYIKYNKANDMIISGNYNEAVELFEELEDFKDSKKKLVECNRRRLYDVVLAETLAKIMITESDGTTYGIKTEGDRLCFYHHSTIESGSADGKIDFEMLVDMNSNEAEYITSYGYYYSFISRESTCEGVLDIAKFSTKNNSLEIDSYTGTIGRSLMLDMANLWSGSLAGKINLLLKKTDLGITAKDLGFVSIED